MKDGNLKREERIEKEILINSYESEERFSSWYNYLLENLGFPFEANWESVTKDTVKVKVVDMTEYEICNDGKDILVEVNNRGEILSVPLFEIHNFSGDSKTFEAIEDWHYWLSSGNNFEDEDEFF